MNYKFSIKQKKNVYDGFFKFDSYKVSFEKFSGGFIENVTRECSKKGDVVTVIPYDPIRREFLLVEQFRIGLMVRGQHPWCLEIVAGFMDVAGEDPYETAKRELFEETGCQAINIYPLIDYYSSPGGSASKSHLFLVTVDADKAKKNTGLVNEGEDICVHKIKLEDIKNKLKNNEISNSTAIIAFQKFFMDGWAEKLET